MAAAPDKDMLAMAKVEDETPIPGAPSEAEDIIGDYKSLGLDDATLGKISHAAWSICVSKPRSGLYKDEMETPPWRVGSNVKGKRPLEPLAAAAFIEIAVARGLSLTRKHLEAIYDEDRSDRRGFWRYFDANPDAGRIVEAVLRAFPAK
ncbi:hypothetical protein AXG89_07480 [Burkholderia sp. PAMC 26561]|nr:hypothetical protein AXG89_07480 [Burkholderia sp. PAMC 26561]